MDWFRGQVSSSAIEEVTGTMLHKIVVESKHLAVLFCKYLGYLVIATTHTCYLLRQYHSGKGSSAGGGNPDLHFLPSQHVRGLAREA